MFSQSYLMLINRQEVGGQKLARNWSTLKIAKKNAKSKNNLKLTTYNARIIFNNVENSKDSARKCLLNQTPVKNRTDIHWRRRTPL